MSGEFLPALFAAGPRPQGRYPVRVQPLKRCLAGARRTYKAKNYRAAVKQCWPLTARWRKLKPGAVACLEEDVKNLPAHMLVVVKEPGLWVTARTTNVTER
jgi:hypothetical protein